MKCPTCKESKLVISERSGIEIDYCPDCRGVWLDRGELDKILERSRSDLEQQLENRVPDSRTPYPQTPYNQPHYKEEKYYKRKKSFLEDLFD